MKKQLFYEELNGDIWTKFDENNQMIIEADQLETVMQSFEERIAEGRLINLRVEDVPEIPEQQRKEAYNTMFFEDIDGTITEAAVIWASYEAEGRHEQAEDLGVKIGKHKDEIRKMFPDAEQKPDYKR